LEHFFGREGCGGGIEERLNEMNGFNVEIEGRLNEMSGFNVEIEVKSNEMNELLRRTSRNDE